MTGKGLLNARKTLLVALDFGIHSNAVLSEALGFAEITDATIHVLHVFTLQDAGEAEPMSRSSYTHLKTSKRSQLEAAGARCRARGRLGTLLWYEGEPAAQILLTANAIDADMILVGASGRNPQRCPRLGSVAEAVARDAECTVMVVRDKKTGTSEDN